MAEELAPWITESSVGRERGAAFLMIAVGLALTIGFRHFDASGLSNSLSGFLLGLLLLLIGAGGLLFGGKITIAVEPRYRRIVISGKKVMRPSKLVIPFQDIARLSLAQQGDRNSGSIRYYVLAHLHSGQEIPLFYGFFEGMFSEPTMERRMARLNRYLHSSS